MSLITIYFSHRAGSSTVPPIYYIASTFAELPDPSGIGDIGYVTGTQTLYISQGGPASWKQVISSSDLSLYPPLASANTFTNKQKIDTNSTPQLEIRNGSNTANNRRYVLHNASDTFYIQGLTDAGTQVPFMSFNATNGIVVSTLLDIATSSGGQIKFPASQNASSNANTLDDYEEGGFTLTDLSGASPALSFTVPANGECRYTKIGNLVMFVCGVQFPATADTHSVTIGGLPFTVRSGCNGGVYVTYRNDGLVYTGVVQGGTTYFQLYTSAGANITNAQLTSRPVYFVGHYFV